MRRKLPHQTAWLFTLFFLAVSSQLFAQKTNAQKTMARYQQLQDYDQASDNGNAKTKRNLTSIPNARVRTAKDRVGTKSSLKEKMVMPKGPNPFLSNSPKKGNYKSWSNYLKEVKRRRYANTNNNDQAITLQENEQEFQDANGEIATAQAIKNFGSGRGQQSKLMVKGALNSVSTDNFPVVDFGQLVEADDADNGDIFNTTPIVFTEDFQTISGSAIIGDGANRLDGSGFGDHDYYQIALLAGQSIRIKTTSTSDNAEFSPAIVIFDDANLFPVLAIVSGDASNDVIFTAPIDEIYYIAIADVSSYIEFDDFFGEETFVTDPFEPSNFRPTPTAEGSYDFEFSLAGKVDIDFYSMNLKKGDVFGLATTGGALVTELYGPEGKLGIGTITAPGIPAVEESPLPFSGDLAFYYTAPKDGNYTFNVLGSIGEYDIEAVVSRPGLEKQAFKKQVIYLDFTGADVALRSFIGVPFEVDPDPVLDEPRTLSPMVNFLEAWGIETTQRNLITLARKITNVVKENIKRDLKRSKINPNLKVEIISDFGVPYLGQLYPQYLERSRIPYSNVVIGGTINEFLLETIGIANAIDPGNFSQDDTAVVLLDLLSSNEVDPFFGDNSNSINFVPLAEGATKIDLVATTVGNIVTHEIGHFLGNFHTEIIENDNFSIMDSGGLPIAFASGTDLFAGGEFGDGNTIDVDFAKDNYFSLEGFSSLGLNETDVNTAFALSFGIRTPRFGKEPLALEQQLGPIEDNMLGKGITGEGERSEISSWPNPQRKFERSKLSFTPQYSGPTTVTLINSQGGIIAEVFNDTVEQGRTKELDLLLSPYNLSPGLYFYKIENGGVSNTHKFLIKN